MAKVTPKKTSKNTDSLTPALERLRKLPLKVKILSTGVVLTAAVISIALVSSFSAQPIIQLAASPGGGESRSTMMSESSDDKMMIMPFTTYSYVAGADLSSEKGSGQVYKLVRTGNPESLLANLAQVFGIEGSVKKYPDFSDENPGYFFGESEDPWGADNLNPLVSL